MIALSIPTTDVNSASATVVRWYVDDRGTISQGVPSIEVETSKAILDVDAPAAGVLLQLCAEGSQVGVKDPLGYVFETSGALEDFVRNRSAAPAEPSDHGARITAPARRRAEELGVDLDALAG